MCKSFEDMAADDPAPLQTPGWFRKAPVVSAV